MRYLLLLLLWLALPCMADDLDRFIEEKLKDYHVPGAAVAVIEKDQVVFLKGFGVTRAGTDQAVNPDTIFALASSTKPFTSAMLATLVDEGRLGWDKPLHLVLADSYTSGHVTLRDLLAHRSGLPAFVGDTFDKLGYSRDEVVRRLRFMPLKGFRETALYSNAGYFLAGMAAGGVWEQQIVERITKPLRLTRTGFYSGPIKVADNVAFPHLLAGGKLTSAPQYDEQGVLAPAGEMSSTARDLARFVRMQLNYGQLDGLQLLKAETVREMHKPSMVAEVGFSEGAPIDAQSGFAYGLGWANYHYRGYEVIEKTGARFGVRSLMTFVPQRQVGVVVLANLNTTLFPEAVRAQILENYLGKAGTDLQATLLGQQKKVDEMMSALGTPLPAPAAPITLPLERYCGTYSNDLYGDLVVEKSGDGLRWALGPARFGAALEPAGYNTFRLTYPPGLLSLPEKITFVIDNRGRPTELVTESFGRFLPTAAR